MQFTNPLSVFASYRTAIAATDSNADTRAVFEAAVARHIIGFAAEVWQLIRFVGGTAGDSIALTPYWYADAAGTAFICTTDPVTIVASARLDVAATFLGHAKVTPAPGAASCRLAVTGLALTGGTVSIDIGVKE